MQISIALTDSQLLRPSFCLKKFSAVIIFLLILSLAPPGKAATKPFGCRPATPAEKFVLDKAVAGQVADLQEAFGPEEGPRRLRAAFFEALLTNALPGVKIHRSGIYLVNAVIAGPLNLSVRRSPPRRFSGRLPL